MTAPILGKIRRFTYRELRDEVVALAAVLRDNGIGKGDRVIIYMPMVAEAAIAMLASPASAPCIRWCSAASPRRNSPPASTTRGPRW